MAQVIVQALYFRPTRAHLTFYVILCASLLVLTACNDTVTTPYSSATSTALKPNATSPSQITATSAFISTQIAATATPVLPTTLAATATGEPQTALQQLANLTSYMFSINQTATLQSNGAISELSADGQGLYVTGALSQTVTLNVGGASQPIVTFVNPNNTAYQMATNLAVWQKLDNSNYGFATNESFTLAASATLQGAETINNVITQKYVYQIAGSQLLKSNGVGPLLFGLLSASSILSGFSASDFAATTINETVWIDPQKSLVLQRQLEFTLKNATGDSLSYQARYAYQNFNQPNLTIQTPANLPQ